MIPGVTVEFARSANPLDPLGGIAWTDISAYVEAIPSIKHGRQHELGRFMSGEATILLANEDRRFDPSYTGGAYGADIKPMKRIRIKETSGPHSLFTGYTESWNPGYMGPARSVVELHCVDALKMLAMLRPTRSPFSDAILKLSPYVYWRFGETTGNVAADASGNGRDGAHNGAVAPGVEGLLAHDDDRAVNFSSLGYTEASASSIADWERTQAFWFAAIAEIPNDGTIWLASKGPAINTNGRGWGVALSPSGVVFLAANTFPTNALQVHAPRPVNDGRKHLIVGSYAGNSIPGGVRIWVDGQECDLVTDQNSLSATIITTEKLKVGPIGRELGATLNAASADIDEFAIGTGALDATQAGSIWSAYSAPWDGQRSDERVTVLLDLIGWPSADRSVDGGIVTLGPQQPLTSVIDELHAVADSELGAFYVAPDGKLRFVGRYTNILDSASALTFGDDTAGTELDYLDLGYEGGDSDLWNEVHATRDGGIRQVVSNAASITSYGRRVKEVAGKWGDDNQARAVGAKLLDRYAQPKLRFAKMKLRPLETAELGTILDLELHTSRVTVKKRPPGGGTISQECWVESIQHAIFNDRWDITLGVVPADTSVEDGDYAVPGVSTIGDGSVVAY